MLRRLLLPALIAVGLATATGGGAQASCAAPPPMNDQVRAAATVFVGTVIYTYDGDRVAHVRVESIWKGPTLRTYVDVHGSSVSGAQAATSVDRRYQSGVRYLFVLFSATQPLQDNECSGTRQYSDDLAALAPPDARTPAPPTPLEEVQNLAGQYLWLVSAASAAVVAAILTSLWTRRRRRRA